MKKITRSRYLRLNIAILFCLLGCYLAGGCAPKPTPQPTQSKEERRMQEKEMMQREMRNK